MTPILELPYDKDKRYLIVGDIHGRFNALQDLLSKSDYNPDKDILIAVGDMIDRGPDSVDVVTFFTTHKNRYSVMGNHEAMMLEPASQDIWLANGGPATIHSIRNSNVNVTDFLEMIRELPFTIYVGEEDDPGAFRVVHAEYPLLPESTLTDSIKAAVSPSSSVLQTCIWSRSTISLYQNFIDDGTNDSSVYRDILESRIEWLAKHQPHRTYMGHSPVDSITRIHNNFYIDTGMRKLTMIDAHSGEYWESSMY